MFMTKKYLFILALCFGFSGQIFAQETGSKPSQSPQISAENSGKSAPPEASEKLPPGAKEVGNKEDPSCLISTFTFRGTYIQILSYSTYGYGPCNEKAFNTLTLPTIAASLATLERKPYFIMKGGLLRSTATSVTIGLTTPYVEIGELKFSVIAETILPLNTLITSPRLLKQGFTATPYVEYPSIEKSYYFWSPGTLIYEIVDQSGQAFVMTSYSSQFDPNIKFDDLKKLPLVLSLPPGWSFRTRTLDKILQVRAKQLKGFTALRVMDEFGNLYIKEE